MKNIITAIGNTNLNIELNKDIYFNVLSQDIQYQDGIFEILEHKSDIDFLIVGQNIPGEYEIIELIEKIINVNCKISIYVILEEKNLFLENELNRLKITSIFYSNQIEIKEMINFIKNDKKQEEENLKEEIAKLKELILKNNLNNEDDNNKENKIKKKSTKKKKSTVVKIQKNMEDREFTSICVSGVHGSGKSIITILIANYFQNQNKRVLIVDADSHNESIHTILGMKKKINSEEKFLKINKNISVFPDFNDFLEFDKKLKVNKYDRFIEHIKNEYDILLIDTSSNIDNGYINKVLKLSNKIIFLVEPNLSEVSKSRKLLDFYLYKLNINKEKINIIFNKVNKNMIDENILNNLFFNIKIIGKILYGKEYTDCINKNKINVLNSKKLLKLCNVNIVRKAGSLWN